MQPAWRYAQTITNSNEEKGASNITNIQHKVQLHRYEQVSMHGEAVSSTTETRFWQSCKKMKRTYRKLVDIWRHPCHPDHASCNGSIRAETTTQINKKRGNRGEKSESPRFTNSDDMTRLEDWLETNDTLQCLGQYACSLYWSLLKERRSIYMVFT